MAKIGFRTSLFGFQKSDVMDYLNLTHHEYAAKEQELKKQNADLEDALKAQKKQAEETAARMAELQQEIDYFRGKEAEIEKMSISIGTMYLVAKQNADEMIQTAERYAAEVTEHAKRQLIAANKASEQLDQLKSGVGESADRFAQELSALSAALEQSRERLAQQMSALEAAGAEVLITDGSEAE